MRGTLYTVDKYETVVVKYIDNNRFDFCQNSLPNGYFWCIVEMHDIVGTVSQN